MKKVFTMLIAVLLLAPVLVHAANTVHVVVADEKSGDSKIVISDPDEESGEVTKKFPVYVTQTDANAEVKSVTIKVSNKADGIVGNATFEAVQPYTMTNEGETGTFAVADNVTGASGAKVHVGFVIVKVKSAAAKCDFTVKGTVNGVKTGASFNIAVIGAGLLLIGGIFAATKSKKKMYNI